MPNQEHCPHCQEKTAEALKNLVADSESDCCQGEKNNHHQEIKEKSSWKKIINIFHKND